MDCYVYDMAKKESRLVVQNKGIGTLEDVAPGNRAVIVNRLVSRGDNDVYVVDLEGGREVNATRHTPPGNFDGRFGKDRNTVYLVMDKDRDLTAFGRVTVKAGAAGAIEVMASRPDAELDSFALNDAGTHAVLLWNSGGRSELSVVNLATGRSYAGPKVPGDTLGGVTFSHDGRSVAMTVSGATQPADIWVWDNFDAARGATAKLRQLTRSPHAGVALSSLIAPELIRYKAHDGLDLSGWLYTPRNVAKPMPVVFSFHGGPESQERPSLSSTYQALLSRGIAVFAPNVRGSSGFGKRFVNLDNGALRVNSVRDIEASVKALTSQGIADPKRLGIMGGSYGGYMVMAGLTEYPDMFAAGANLFGVVNFETFFAQSEPWMAEISTIEYGNPKTELEMLRSLSPINKIDRVKAPTLVLHGANDTNVPVVEAEQVVNRLKERGVPVEYVLFPDEGHGWRKTANRVKSAVPIVRFFEEKLK
jgi:dipeptidyl aminopeptidase/acylaminoacyl peptidase